ncbi:MAG: hypothetical protein ACOYN0_09975 [Phycisphaerales bacterium]
MKMRVLVGAAALGASVVVSGLTSGCAQPPRGEPVGRADVYDTTPAERNSREILPAALAENSDQVAQHLAGDLQQIPELNGPDRATVVFGDIVNKTSIVPTSDFEAFRTRTRQKLMQSSYIRSKLNFIENRARLENLQDREMIGNGRKPMDPDRTFFLNGAMYRIARGATESVNLYELSWELTRASDGSIVWQSAPYEVKQVR